MSVCKFRRPTSCRPCLISSMALSYRILSGSAVFSALVDLLTFFFLWKICASLCVALSRRIPDITNRAERFTLDSNVCRLTAARNVHCLTVASFEVPRQLHLSLKSRSPSHNPPTHETIPDSLRFEPADHTL